MESALREDLKMEKMIRLNEVAKQLGVHRATLRRWILSGQGPTAMKTPGGFFVCSEEDVKKWRDQLRRIEPTVA